MTKEDILITKLVAADGTTLTNGEHFGKVVYLGITDKADNWREIPDSEVTTEDSEVEGELE